MEAAKPSRRSSSATVHRSPVLKRTASGESSLSLPEARSMTRTRTPSPAPQQQPINNNRRPSRSTTSSPRPSVDRSISALRLRTTSAAKGKETEQPTKKLLLSSSIISSPKIPLPSDAVDAAAASAARLSIRRASPHNMSMRRGAGRSTLTTSSSFSPSAWALSPGRTLAAPLPPSSPSSPSPSLTTSPSLQRSTPTSKARSSSSLGSSVLRYFQRHKPANSPEEDQRLHQYRLMSNRLLQWRFANAKSDASMRILKKKSEERLFAVWVKVCKLRNSMAEKRSRVQRLRLKIKLLGMVCPQIQLLEEWELALEKKNSEAVGRVARKLSAYSIKLPLVNGAKVDIVDLYEAMRFALEAEETCEILTQVIGSMGEHDKCFQELHTTIATIMSLEVRIRTKRLYIN
ncbi:hypothetical protein V2J09_019414 [Rumex salicifolius]